MIATGTPPPPMPPPPPPPVTADGGARSGGRPERRRLSGELARLATRFAHRPVRLGEVTDVLQLRGYNAILLFLAFPFVTPVPLPGVSTPFGLVIALLGLRMALDQRPWLPERLTAHELSGRLLPKVLLGAGRVLGRLERLLKPRLLYPEFPALFQRASGILIVLCGLLLVLPLPVPFSNTMPALTIILLAVAGLERDGAFFIAGCVQFLLCLAFFAALVFGGNELWERLVQ